MKVMMIGYPNALVQAFAENADITLTLYQRVLEQ